MHSSAQSIIAEPPKDTKPDTISMPPLPRLDQGAFEDSMSSWINEPGEDAAGALTPTAPALAVHSGPAVTHMDWRALPREEMVDGLGFRLDDTPRASAAMGFIVSSPTTTMALQGSTLASVRAPDFGGMQEGVFPTFPAALSSPLLPPCACEWGSDISFPASGLEAPSYEQSQTSTISDATAGDADFHLSPSFPRVAGLAGLGIDLHSEEIGMGSPTIVTPSTSSTDPSTTSTTVVPDNADALAPTQVDNSSLNVIETGQSEGCLLAASSKAERTDSSSWSPSVKSSKKTTTTRKDLNSLSSSPAAVNADVDKARKADKKPRSRQRSNAASIKRTSTNKQSSPDPGTGSLLPSRPSAPPSEARPRKALDTKNVQHLRGTLDRIDGAKVDKMALNDVRTGAGTQSSSAQRIARPQLR